MAIANKIYTTYTFPELSLFLQTIEIPLILEAVFLPKSAYLVYLLLSNILLLTLCFWYWSGYLLPFSAYFIILYILHIMCKGGRIFFYVSHLHGPIKQGRSVEKK